MYRKYGQKTAPCVFCTSALDGGRRESCSLHFSCFSRSHPSLAGVLSSAHGRQGMAREGGIRRRQTRHYRMPNPAYRPFPTKQSHLTPHKQDSETRPSVLYSRIFSPPGKWKQVFLLVNQLLMYMARSMPVNLWICRVLRKTFIYPARKVTADAQWAPTKYGGNGSGPIEQRKAREC